MSFVVGRRALAPDESHEQRLRQVTFARDRAG